MTDSITKAINDWLLTYTPIVEFAQTIQIEELDENVGSLALLRTGVELVQQYLRGRKEQYQYMLYLKAESEDDLLKIENLNWLDKFNDWVCEQSIKGNLPQIDGRVCTRVTTANAITAEVTDDGAISSYAIQLYFDIK